MANFDLSYRYAQPSPRPQSGWEQLLASMCIDEKECATNLIRRTRKGRMIRSWTLAHYSTSYVPEWILQILGLHQRLSRRWQELD